MPNIFLCVEKNEHGVMLWTIDDSKHHLPAVDADVELVKSSIDRHLCTAFAAATLSGSIQLKGIYRYVIRVIFFHVFIYVINSDVGGDHHRCRWMAMTLTYPPSSNLARVVIV